MPYWLACVRNSGGSCSFGPFLVLFGLGVHWFYFCCCFVVSGLGFFVCLFLEFFCLVFLGFVFVNGKDFQREKEDKHAIWD